MTDAWVDEEIHFGGEVLPLKIKVLGPTEAPDYLRERRVR